jgi:hypothetical protein
MLMGYASPHPSYELRNRAIQKMPRIRIRTPDGERIVGTPNCSTLTVRLLAHAQRSTLQLRADAELNGGDTVLERWTWDFPELKDDATIELISERGERYDPADASHKPKQKVTPVPDGQSKADIRVIEQELETLAAQLNGIRVGNRRLLRSPIRGHRLFTAPSAEPASTRSKDSSQAPACLFATNVSRPAAIS